MDRPIVYAGSIPLDTDMLWLGRNAKIGFGQIASQLFGREPGATGLVCSVLTGALAVEIAPGAVIGPGVVDATLYGGNGSGLVADNSLLMCQYLSNVAQQVSVGMTGTTVTLYAVCSEVDTDAQVLPFYNVSNPSQTQAGIGNSGAALPTMRRGQIAFSVGTSAPAAPQGGCVVALYAIAVPAGASDLSGATITALAPFYPTIPVLAKGRLLREIRISSTGAYSSGSDAALLEIEQVGGGASGAGVPGNAANYVSVGSSGGAGAYARYWCSPVRNGQVVIGAGGAVTAAGAGANAGGDTNFCGLVVTGGAQANAAGTSIAPGVSAQVGQGVGGSVTVLDASAVEMVVSYAGPNASSSYVFSNGAGVAGVAVSALGASGPFGSGGANTNGSDGNPAHGYGAGGGGSASVDGSAHAGGAGTGGLVIVREWSGFGA